MQYANLAGVPKRIQSRFRYNPTDQRPPGSDRPSAESALDPALLPSPASPSPFRSELRLERLNRALVHRRRSPTRVMSMTHKPRPAMAGSTYKPRRATYKARLGKRSNSSARGNVTTTTTTAAAGMIIARLLFVPFRHACSASSPSTECVWKQGNPAPSLNPILSPFPEVCLPPFPLFGSRPISCAAVHQRGGGALR